MKSQMLLIRVVERGGVKVPKALSFSYRNWLSLNALQIFYATSWNYDWTLSPGSHELYDDWLGFGHHVELSSTIKPIYMFTGAIPDYYFKKSNYDWDRMTKTFNFHGSSTFPTRYTTAEDIGNYILEAITAPDAANGGYVRVQSLEASPEDVVKAYGAARKGRITTKLNCLGSLKDAETKLNEGRLPMGRAGVSTLCGISTDVISQLDLGTTSWWMLHVSRTSSKVAWRNFPPQP